MSLLNPTKKGRMRLLRDGESAAPCLHGRQWSAADVLLAPPVLQC